MSARKYCLIIVLLFPLALSAQDITGLWRGYMHNDTTGKDLRYELAISEKNGKLSGYSYTFFLLDDHEYFGLKKVKIRREDGKIIVQDQELLSNNYPIPPNKGVRQLNVLTLEVRDSAMILSGPFSTNQTKVYSVLTGSINVQRKGNYMQSALVPHLEEMGLAKDLSFVVPEISTPDIAAINKPVIAGQPDMAVVKKNNQSINIKETKISQVQFDTVKTVPVAVVTKPVEPVTKPVELVKAKDPNQAAADVDKRRIETIQSVYFKSDSLVLTLYDNGVVDGDTVSVLMNGKMLMPKVGLSTRAVKKTVYLTADMPDSIQLIMYAENLGSIAPNTGLLVVLDGEDIYEIRFSGDMNKNSAIVFKRRR